MSFINPNDSSEVLYGASGDVRDEINTHLAAAASGHYFGEEDLPGALIIKSLQKSTRLINTYLEPVYPDQVPFAAAADVPKFLEEVGNDIATYYVFRSAYAKLGNLPDDKKADYFDKYIGEDGFLTKISERKIALPELAPSNPSDANNVRKGYTPIFDVDADTNQRVDTNLLDDIDRERS